MPELVMVSEIDRLETVKTYINSHFENGRYAEIVQAIGMYSILIDPERAIKDQDLLYRLVLNLLKNKIAQEHRRSYSTWIQAFPALLEQLVMAGIITDEAARSSLLSRHAAFGRFSSLDEFYYWALDDRRLPLDQIILHVQKTVETHIAQNGK
ncbi:MAG: hypothetical protein OEW15_02990 [Nitrospirota bacterium]|nr:hypothetical protein [Nitrospirota bacterium]